MLSSDEVEEVVIELASPDDWPTRISR